MGKCSRTLKASAGRKQDNNPSAHQAKLQIRRNVLDVIGPEKAAVLDCFCGAGEMYAGVWNEAARYQGIDRKWHRDERLCFAADNLRVLRAIDVAPFNCFDLDGYGSPWQQATIIAARRPVLPGETIGIVLTEGSALKIKMGTLPHALARLARLNPKMSGAARQMDDVIDRAILGLARRMSCRVVLRWDAEGKTGAQVRYIGLVLERAAATEPGNG